MTLRDQLLVRRVGRLVQELGPRSRIVLSQLPIVLSLTLVFSLAPPPEDIRLHPGFVLGLTLQAVIALLCFAVPWGRFGDNAALAIPLMDLVSLWLLRNGSGTELTGLGSLVAFPVIWIAASTVASRWMLALCTIGPVAIVLPTLLDSLPSPTASDWAVFVSFPLIMLATAVAIRVAGAGIRVQERQLRVAQGHLRRLLRRAEESEQLLAGILDASSVGILAVDRDGHPLRWNEAFRSLLAGVGWESPESFDVADAAFPVFAADRRSPVRPDDRVLTRAARGEEIDGEMCWLGWGPRARALQIVARPVGGEHGGAVVSYADVTQLAQTVEDKAQLVRTVAHEFRTPLTSVLGNLDLALDSRGLPADVRSRLLVALGNAERLVDMAGDLMASSELTLPVRPAHTDLCAVLTARAEASQAAADAARVRLVVDLPEHLWVHADPLRVGQAVDNLLSNAVKYSPDGGVVTLRAAEALSWATIEVSDTGMGIAAEDRELIFDRFYRTDSAKGLDIPGVGLGLSLTRMVAERHGGRLEVESEPGCGSVFSLVLPVTGPPER